MLKFTKLAIFFSTLLVLVSCEKIQVEQESREVFGAICSVNLYKDGTERLYEKIFNRLDEIDNQFNFKKQDSETAKVNKNAGNYVNVSDEFIQILQVSLLISKDFKYSFIDEKSIEIDKSHNKVKTEKGSILDFGDILKGYAVDEIVKILKQNKVKGATLTFDGMVYVFGTKKNKSPWMVEIKNPTNPNGISILSLTGLQNTAIVTHGTYEKLFTKSKYAKENEIQSVTVICNNAINAETLCNTFFIIGTDKAFDFAKDSSDSILVIIIKSDGKIFASKELKGYLGLMLDDYNISFR